MRSSLLTMYLLSLGTGPGMTHRTLKGARFQKTTNGLEEVNVVFQGGDSKLTQMEDEV